MKLLKMHVENFGRLHEFDFDFAEGMNIILEENGWGKTTMATFIKAMLYGFDSDSFHNEGERERRRYKPWQGGVYGGSLDFEYRDRAYRVMRTFGDKPEADKVSVIDIETGNAAPFHAQNLGEDIFHLDAGAFERSVFIRQNGLLTEDSSTGIQARLSALISEANASKVYDTASNELDRKIRMYERADGRGELARISRELSNKASEKEEIHRSVAKQKELYESLYAIDDRIRQTDEELQAETAIHREAFTNVGRQKTILSQIARIEEEIRARTHQQEVLKDELGGTIPAAEEIEESRRVREALQAEKSEAAQDDAEKKKLYTDLSSLMGRYHNQLPTDVQLDEIQKADRELNSAEVAKEQEDSHFRAVEVPEGYTILSQVSKIDPSYLRVIREAIGVEDEIRSYRTEAEIRANAIRNEEESWKTVQKGYNAVHSALEKAQSDLKSAWTIFPAQAEQDIEQLNQLKAKRDALETEAKTVAPLIEKEDGDFTAAKETYEKLHGNTEQLRKKLDENELYAPDLIDPLLANLRELSNVEVKVNECQDLLTRNGLTEEEEKILDENPGELPEEGGLQKMVERLHAVQEKEVIRASRTAKLNTENVKADGLKAEIQKIDESIQTLPNPGSEPSKGMGGVLIALGVIVMIAGAVAGYLVRIELAGIAAAGLVLLILGFTSSNKAKKERAVYDAALAEYNRKKEEKEQEKAKVQTELDGIENGIKSLTTDLDLNESEIVTGRKELSDWMAKYGTKDTEVTADAIRKVYRSADRVRTVRAKETKLTESRDFVLRQSNNIQTILKDISDTYTKTTGMTIADMIKYLGYGKDEFLKLKEDYEAALSKEKEFVADSGFSQEVLDGTSTLLPSEAKTRYEQITQGLKDIDIERAAINAKYEGLEPLSYEAAAAELRIRVETRAALEAQARGAADAEADYLEEVGQTRQTILRPESAKHAALVKEQQEKESAFSKLSWQVQTILKRINLLATDDEDLLAKLAVAKAYVSAYETYAQRKEEYETASAEHEKDVNAKKQTLSERLAILGDVYGDRPINERIAMVQNDRATAFHLAETLKTIETRMRSREASMAEKQAKIDEFDQVYGLKIHDKEHLIDEIASRSEAYRREDEPIASLQQRLEETRNELNTIPKDCVDAEHRSAEKLRRIKDRREIMLVERTNADARISAIDSAVVKYPEVEREIRTLSEQKEKALNDLRVLRKTLNLLRQAKDNLSGRYYTRVEKLFNEYMHIWLDSDTIRAIVDEDLNVSIQENGKARGAQGYSAGYCDLIDFCMRMALVDTLFESEQPFLIMDDPFVNLDQDRLTGALELLNAVAATRQIIYFVCHPVRTITEESDTERRAEFNRIAEEADVLRSAQKKAEDARRMKENLPHYTVSGSGVPFAPADPQMIIRDTAVRMSFVKTQSMRTEERTYELFFVDEAGMVVSDRKLLELSHGELIPEDIRFLLHLPEHVSTRVDLLVKRVGSDEFEINARFPFRVLITARS